MNDDDDGVIKLNRMNACDGNHERIEKKTQINRPKVININERSISHVNQINGDQKSSYNNQETAN